MWLSLVRVGVINYVYPITLNSTLNYVHPVARVENRILSLSLSLSLSLAILQTRLHLAYGIILLTQDNAANATNTDRSATYDFLLRSIITTCLS